jgi:hypothetical protein
VTPRTVHLGFEVGSGAPVEIPLKHMAICGQTQEAGKTTALEALITRAGVRAVTFITKRGEGSFTEARRIDPYFREQADWQFVASILEASRGEKLKFERAWIIRASKGARTLADVQRNVRKAMETAKGLAGDVYLTLDAYLEAVVPAIAAVDWATSVQLAAGVNVMDLTSVPSELQHLVIRSTIDWILEREADTVVVVPEAWKFIPQGRGTPVKLGAAAFIRQGAGLRNYLWLDSQDLGGIEKEILRSVPLWILGVQREANEIKRTLENIPASVKKPSKADIATLELGQFYACWGKHAIKTYVQPAWMHEELAQQVALGNRAAADAAGIAILSGKLSGAAPVDSVRAFSGRGRTQEEKVDASEARKLRDENTRLHNQVVELGRQLEDVRNQLARAVHDRVEPAAPERGHRAASRPAAAAAGATPNIDDAVYRQLLARLVADAAKDPQLLRIIASKPELEVVVHRRVVEADADTLRGRIALLIADGFFDVEPRTGTYVESELRRQAFACSRPNVYRELDKIAADGFLTKENGGYKAVAGMKRNIVEAA